MRTSGCSSREDGREAGRGLLDIGLPEAVREAVRRLAHHPGVDVAQELDPVDAQHVGGGEGLRDPPLPQRLAVGEHARLGLTSLPAGGDDEHHPPPGRLGLGHEAAGGDGFVVGVGVEADQGGHGGHASGRRAGPITGPVGEMPTSTRTTLVDPLWKDRPMTGYIEPTASQLERLVVAAPQGPVTMLNLLAYRDNADYSSAPEMAPASAISGRDAYGLYSAGVLPILADLGGEVVVFGPCRPTLIGPPEESWDDIALIRYPTLDAFTAMVASPQYQAIMGHRNAALADSRLVPTGAVSP